MVNRAYQKWLTKLVGYDFEIHYKPRLENKAADALLLMPWPIKVLGLVVSRVVALGVLAAQVAADEHLGRFVQEIHSGTATTPGYSLLHMQLLFKGRLVIPKGAPLIPLLLHEGHDGSIGVHSGFLKTYKGLVAHYCWEGMKHEIMEYVAKCSVYQQKKSSS